MEQKSSKLNEVQVVDERLTCNFKKSATGSIIVLLFRCCTQKTEKSGAVESTGQHLGFVKHAGI